MPTLEELEGMKDQAPTSPELPSAVAPQQAAPQHPGPSLDELVRLTTPRLDHTLDGPSPIEQSMGFVQDNFQPGLHWNDENIPFEQRTAQSRFREKGFAGLTWQESAMKQNWGSRAWERAIRGFADTALDTISFPGKAAKAFHESDIGGSGTSKFDYTWKAPVTSLLYGVSQVADKLKQEIEPTTDEFGHPMKGPENLNWGESVPGALGSAAAFILGGKAAGPESLTGEALTSGGLGAMQGGASQYDEALAMGANPDDAQTALWGGAAFGATEGFPGFYFIKRLNKLGLGNVMEKMNNFGLQGESGLKRELIKGALTEAIQEGVQTVGSNWVAKDIAGYDPTRTLGENFWDNVLTAGVTGSMVGGGIQLLHDADIDEAKKKFEDEYQKRLMSGDAINTIATPGGSFGSFTPVDTLLQLNHLKATLDRHIDQKAQYAFDQQQADLQNLGEVNMGFPSPPLGIDVDAAMGIGLSPELTETMPQPAIDSNEQNFIRTGGNGLVNDVVEKALPKKGMTVREALVHTPVVTMPTRYDQLLKVSKQYLAKYEDMVKNPDNYQWADASVDPGEANQDLITEVQAHRLHNIYKLRVAEFEQKQNISNALLRSTKDYMAAFREAYNPDMKLVLRDFDTRGAGNTESIGGWFSGSSDVDLDGKNRSAVGTLYINLETLVHNIWKGGAQRADAEFKSAKRAIFEVVNHELGHAVLSKHFSDVLKQVRDGTPDQARAAYKTFILLEQEYKNWLGEMSQSTQDKLLSSSFALQRAASYTKGAQQGGVDIKSLPMDAPNPAWPSRGYLLSFDEFFAEMTSRLATQGELSDPAMTKFFKPVLEQYQKIFANYPEFARSEFGNSWKEFLQSRALSYKIKQELEAIQARGGKDLYDALRGKVDGLDPDNFAGLRQQLDRWNKGLSLGLNILQLERMFPHVPQFATYRQTVEKWAAFQRNFAAAATETLENWRSLGKKESSDLTDVLFEESEKRANFPPSVLTKRLSGESLAVYQSVREQLNRVLDEMRATTLGEANREFATNKEKLLVSQKAINEEFDKLKNSGYFPFVRFGDHTLIARAKEPVKAFGQDFKAGELITFQAFESKKERDAAYSKLRGDLGNKAAVSAGKMRESDYVIQGMPRALLLGLRNRLQKDGQLTPDVEQAIELSLQEATPFKSFRNHFKKKKGIHGYSEDAFRTFAHYIRSAAGNISRVKYSGEMRESIDSMQADVKTIQELGGYSESRQEMASWLRRHFDYVMNPASELAALRGVGFVAYLGFNIKSAFVNMTQQLTTTYPYLAARYGDTKAVANIIKAQHFLKNWVFKKNSYINAKPGSTEDRHTKLIAQGKTEGWLDQSLATELAIAASENSLDRSLYLPSQKRFWHAFSRWSALPFHLVEKMNRYVTAIAAYNLEFEQTGEHGKAVTAAKMANYSTNFENARWNRPEFLRGKKSAALLFQNFVQNQLFFVTKDPGSTRYLLMMLLLAGVLGLPGADDISDVVDAAATKLNKELGMKNPKFQLRQEARDYLNKLGANPDLVLHGLSQDSFGMGQVGELAGLPIPRFDLSASIGMGNIVPGTNIPGMMMQSTPGDVALELGSQVSGASGNLVEDYYRGLFSKEPNDWKRAEKLLPLMSMRNMSKAARFAIEGKERAANGVVVADFTPYDARSGLEIFGQGLGFPIRENTLGWEKELAKRDAVQFYKVYQSSVQRQLNVAYMQEDREAIADARAALAQYNSQVPFPEMGIKPKDAKQAVHEYVKSQYKAGAGFEADRKFHRLSKLLEESYPDPHGDRMSKDVDFQP